MKCYRDDCEVGGGKLERGRDPEVEFVCLASSLMINSKKTVCHLLNSLNPSAAIAVHSVDLC